MKLHSFYLFLLCALFSTVAHANPQQSNELDVIVIEGQNLQALSIHNVIGSHQSIDLESTQQHFSTLSSLLEQQSGIEIQSIGGLGQYASPVIRGSNGKQVMVFWDGLLINGISGVSADIGNLGLSHAHSIDIYRSLAPIELSASAVGGVIHIKSQDFSTSAKENNGALSLTAGSYGARQMSFRQAFEQSLFQWLLAGEYTEAKNDFEYLEARPVSHPNHPDYESRHNNAAAQYNVILKGQRKFESHQFNLAIQSNHSDREISTKINAPTNQANISSNSNHLQTSWLMHWSEHSRSEIITSIEQQTQLYDDRYSSVGLGNQLNEYESLGYKLQANQYWDFNAVESATTLRMQSEATQADYKLLTDEEIDAQCIAGRGCKSPYRRMQVDIGTRITYRMNQFEYSLQGALLEIQNHNLTSNNESNITHHTTWSLGVSRYFNSGFSLFYSMSEQLRVPSTNEVFGDRGLSKGNDELNPEHAFSHDIGFRFQNSKLEYISSIYLRDVIDAIHSETDSSGIIRYDNLGKTRHIGWEHTLTYQPFNMLSLSANVTLQNNEIIEDERFSIYEEKQVAGYSQVYSYIDLKYLLASLDISISHTFEDGGYYRNSNSRKKDTKNQWNISIGKNINTWRFSLDIVDINNNAARDYVEYPEPGRQIYLKTQTKW